MHYLSKKLCVLIFVCASGLQAEPITLGVPQLKPFTYLEDGEIKGSVIDPIVEALKQSQTEYTFKFIENYSGLLKATRNNEIDGFFVATKNIERDKIAVFSKPVFIDKYTWFMLNDATYEFGSDEFMYDAKVGAVINTNSFRLATRRGYFVVGLPSEELAQRFINRNLDAVFATYSSFKYQLDTQGIPSKRYRVINDSKRPFGVYISKHYLRKHPGFMKILNRQIKTKKN